MFDPDWQKGVARANALQSKTFQGQGMARTPFPPRTRALAAYKDFLTLWKDADLDIPIYNGQTTRRVAPV